MSEFIVKIRNSGKFLAVLSVFGYLALAASGEMEWVVVADKVEVILLALLGVQGVENAVVKYNVTKKADQDANAQNLYRLHR